MSYLNALTGWAQQRHVVSITDIIYTDIIDRAANTRAAELNQELIYIQIKELRRRQPTLSRSALQPVYVGEAACPSYIVCRISIPIVKKTLHLRMHFRFLKLLPQQVIRY